MVTFPKNFYFGSATSATQSEGSHNDGHKGDDIWDKWFQLEPNRFYDEVGPYDTSNFYKNFEEDIEFLVQTGHNSFRTSISWSRLFPKGYGEINQNAVDFYKSLFVKLKEKNIEPFVNLYHFDMPLAMQEIGGWENPDVVNYYNEYARTCFELFGDVVKRWFTFNEPIVHVECGYLKNYHYPCKVDPSAAVRVAFNTALASAMAVNTYHDMGLGGKIGIVLNLTPAYPRSDNLADVKAAEIAELFANKSFLDPALRGWYDRNLIRIIKKHELLPFDEEYRNKAKVIMEKGTVDFLGVNYYHPYRVCARASLPNPFAPFMPEYYFDEYDMPGKKVNPYRGWEIYPKGLYDIAKNIQENYGNIEWLVTENGMGVENETRFLNENGVIEDDYRIDFYKDHLRWLSKAIDEGANCIGYHVWTFIDCWSWLNAYKNRYGLVSYDLKTGKKTIKKSGTWFKTLAERHGFDDKSN